LTVVTPGQAGEAFVGQDDLACSDEVVDDLEQCGDDVAFVELGLARHHMIGMPSTVMTR
jgi:hypothetical protein